MNFMKKLLIIIILLTITTSVGSVIALNFFERANPVEETKNIEDFSLITYYKVTPCPTYLDAQGKKDKVDSIMKHIDTIKVAITDYMQYSESEEETINSRIRLLIMDRIIEEYAKANPDYDLILSLYEFDDIREYGSYNQCLALETNFKSGMP